MPVLSDSDRADCATKFIRQYFASLGNTADLDTLEIRTLVNDIDAYVDANATAMNQSITLAVRQKASLATKGAAFAYVALKRAGAL